MHVDGPGADRAPPRQGHASPAVVARQRSQNEAGCAHGLDQVVRGGRFRLGCPAHAVSVGALFDCRADAREQRGHRSDVGHGRNAAQRDLALRQQGRCQGRQCCVLGPADVYGSGQGPSALDSHCSHCKASEIRRADSPLGAIFHYDRMVGRAIHRARIPVARAELPGQPALSSRQVAAQCRAQAARTKP